MPREETVFVYGTLLFDAVLARLLGRVPPGESATLTGYARHPVRGAPYPALVAESGGRVEGRLLSGLGEADVARLDAYEGPEYRRVRVTVTTSRGNRRTAWAWVFPGDRRHRLASGDWDPEDWAARHLPAWR
ncbi:MAG: gamma-glutamylcyclotransferase family protein [Pseudomonadota bacterium]